MRCTEVEKNLRLFVLLFRKGTYLRLFGLQLSSARGGNRALSIAIVVPARAGMRDVYDLINGRRLCVVVVVVVALLGQAAGNGLVDVPRHWRSAWISGWTLREELARG
jgi:hypothetical protein